MSSRILTEADASRAALLLSPAFALLSGRSYHFEVIVTLAGVGDEYTFSLLTGDDPVHVAKFMFEEVGSDDVSITSFERGEVSGGTTNTTLEPLNRHRNGGPPFLPTDLLNGVTIDVPGTEFRQISILNGRRVASSEFFDSVIWEANTQYYFTVKNNDSQTSRMEVNVVCASLGSIT